MKIWRIVFCVCLLWVGSIIVYLFASTHKHDAYFKTECEKAGGVFLEARNPMSICIKTESIIPLKETK